MSTRGVEGESEEEICRVEKECDTDPGAGMSTLSNEDFSNSSEIQASESSEESEGKSDYSKSSEEMDDSDDSEDAGPR